MLESMAITLVLIVHLLNNVLNPVDEIMLSRLLSLLTHPDYYDEQQKQPSIQSRDKAVDSN